MPEEVNLEDLTLKPKPKRRRAKSAVAKTGKNKKSAYPDTETFSKEQFVTMPENMRRKIDIEWGKKLETGFGENHRFESAAEKFTPAPESPIREIKREQAPKPPARHSSQITEEVFFAIVGLAAMFVVAVMLIASFISIGIDKFVMNFPSGAPCCQNTSTLARGSIIYAIDKKMYDLGEEMRVKIINNSDKSIYLAPCQYFTEFQRKVGNGWQIQTIAPCDSSAKQASGEFEKVPEKVEEQIPTSSLGAGIWRGVSNIYLDCRQAKAESCAGRQKIYSSEFRIENIQNNATPRVSESPKP